MTYGPDTGDTGLAQPPRALVGLLVGLVVVLLMICGGIGYTAWWLVGIDTGDQSAVSGPTWRPPAGTSDPSLPTGTPADPALPSGGAAPVAPTPSAVPSAVPARGSLVPFSASHVVEWPDHLQAAVVRARNFDLPASLAAIHPDEAEVLVEVHVANYTPNDVTLYQAAAKLWYGPGRQPAEEYVDEAENVGRGFYMSIWSGHNETGGFVFLVPRQYLSQLVFELRPRPGDAPAHFFGGAV
jgi:hypothetical protein